MVDVSRPPS